MRLLLYFKHAHAVEPQLPQLVAGLHHLLHAWAVAAYPTPRFEYPRNILESPPGLGNVQEDGVQAVLLVQAQEPAAAANGGSVGTGTGVGVRVDGTINGVDIFAHVVALYGNEVVHAQSESEVQQNRAEHNIGAVVDRRWQMAGHIK